MIDVPANQQVQLNRKKEVAKSLDLLMLLLRLPGPTQIFRAITQPRWAAAEIK